MWQRNQNSLPRTSSIMTKKDITEIKRIFKSPESCSVDKLIGCYVNGNKEKVTVFTTSLLSTDDDEIYKYLDIAKKVLSGKIGDSQLYAPVIDSQGQKELLTVVKSGLKDENVTDALFDKIIDTYDYAKNFLILLYHDVYDVITKTSDGQELDESEYAHEYILCAICPVSLSKPGLGYLTDENRIGARIRDWVVGAPVNGFIYPAFTDRTTDVDHVQFYCKNVKDLHPELLTQVLECEEVTPAAAYRDILESAVSEVLQDNEEINPKYAYMDVQQALQDHIEENGCEVITGKDVKNLAEDAGIDEDSAKKIADMYTEEIGDDKITNEVLLDEKVIKAAQDQEEVRTLKETVKDLSQKLNSGNTTKNNSSIKQMLVQAAEEVDGKYVITKEDFEKIFV